MRALTLIFCLLFPMVAVSEEVIRLPFEKLPEGTVLIYDIEGEDSEVRYITYDENGVATFSIFEFGKERTKDTAFTVDALGRIVHYTHLHDRKTVYDPHNCVRVIGECSYTFTNPNGGTYPRKYFSEFIDGVLHIQIRNADNDFLLLRYEMTYRDDGMLLKTKIIFESGRNKGAVRTIRLRSIVPPTNSIPE